MQCRTSKAGVGQIARIGTLRRVKRIDVASLIFVSVLGFSHPNLMSLPCPPSLLPLFNYRNAITALGYEVLDIST